MRLRFSPVLFVPMVLIALIMAAAPHAAAQTNKTPDLTTATWTVDRYAPQTFQSTFFQGRDAILIGTDPSGGSANRPAGYQSTFYDWQGETTNIDPVGTPSPADQMVKTWLWMDPAWQGVSGVSTSMWTRTNQVGSDAEETAYYPIINFNNGGFRYWDSVNGWQGNNPITFSYGDWLPIELQMTGVWYRAFVNDQLLFEQYAPGGTTRLDWVGFENHNDGVTSVNAYWSSDPTSSNDVGATPEPITLTLLGSGLLGIGGALHRRRKKNPDFA